MKDVKQAIILDLDETLEHGTMEFAENKTLYIMTLRPQIEKLAKRLKEIRKEDLADVILCTDASREWVEVFLKKCPEMKGVFNKIYSKTNRKEWEEYDEEKYEIEYILDRKEGKQKPVTTFGYDRFLFIDDNIAAGRRLKEIANRRKENMKDISYYSGGGFFIDLKSHLHFKNAAKGDKEIANEYEKLLDISLEEPGVEYMIEVINTFLKKGFKEGFNNYDENYDKIYHEYKKRYIRTKDRVMGMVLRRDNERGKSSYYTKDEMIEYFIKNADLSMRDKEDIDEIE